MRYCWQLLSGKHELLDYVASIVTWRLVLVQLWPCVLYYATQESQAMVVAPQKQGIAASKGALVMNSKAGGDLAATLWLWVTANCVSYMSHMSDIL